MSKPSESIRVVLRCRPLNSTEKSNGNRKIVEMDSHLGIVSVENLDDKDNNASKQFTYDSVFDSNSTQEGLFMEAALPIVDSVLEGYNGTIFAYGQTGTGKTHSMEGGEGELRGITPRSFEHIFNYITMSKDKKFMVSATFLEIYNDEIRDLIDGNGETKLELKEKVKENGEKEVYVQDISVNIVQSIDDVNNLLERGRGNRKKGATLMNANSSRSHCIFSLTVECGVPGKLNLVDLAGSERQEKTQAQGARLKEASKINLSLSTLGNVIAALTTKPQPGKEIHIPYRDSKLTRLLQDSLGGNTKTVMVANIGPADYNFNETIGTLRFASRAKKIQNKPTINEDPKDTMLREYQETILLLKKQLEGLDSGGAVGQSSQLVVGPSGKLEPKIIVNEKIVIKEVVKTKIDEAKVKQLEESQVRRKKEIEEKMIAEKESLSAQTMSAEEKAGQLAKQLKKQDKQIARGQNEREALIEQLKEIESKMLFGNQMIEEASKQEKILEEKKAIIQKKEEDRKKLQLELQQKGEMQLGLVNKYESLEKTISDRTEKLQKLHSKIQEIEADIGDVQNEFQREREDTLENIRELQRHLQLKQLVIDLFVPYSECEKIESRAQWDADRAEWILAPIDFNALLTMKRPSGSKPNSYRPVSQYSRIASVLHDQVARYRHENVLQYELDMPERTTQDFNNGQ